MRCILKYCECDWIFRLNFKWFSTHFSAQCSEIRKTENHTNTHKVKDRKRRKTQEKSKLKNSEEVKSIIIFIYCIQFICFCDVAKTWNCVCQIVKSVCTFKARSWGWKDTRTRQLNGRRAKQKKFARLESVKVHKFSCTVRSALRKSALLLWSIVPNKYAGHSLCVMCFLRACVVRTVVFPQWKTYPRLKWWDIIRWPTSERNMKIHAIRADS